MAKAKTYKRDEELYQLGKTIRREVVGSEYDDQLQNVESDFSQPIRDWSTVNVWGTVWADDALSRKTRSLLNVALTTALRCSHETRVHVRGALRNGCTEAEIRAVLMQVMVYGGVLAVREAVRNVNQVLAEEKAKKKSSNTPAPDRRNAWHPGHVLRSGRMSAPSLNGGDKS